MRERMEAGDLYIAVDPELGELSSRALDLAQAYNATFVSRGYAVAPPANAALPFRGCGCSGSV